jgi:hypothetical protein
MRGKDTMMTLTETPLTNGAAAAAEPAANQPAGIAVEADATLPQLADDVVEIRLPSPAGLRAHFRASVIDANGVDPKEIISVSDGFYAKFELYLTGDLWRVMCGSWCLDLSFESAGPGPEANLSDLLHLDDIKVYFVGCKHRRICVNVWVPPNTVPTDYCSRIYEVKATFQLHDQCGKPVAVLGHQDVGDYQFYLP